MKPFFCTIGNESSSFENLQFGEKSGYLFTSKDRLTGTSVQLSSELEQVLKNAFGALPTTDVVDVTIGVNPNPGERYVETRDTLHLRVGGFEYKFFISSPPSKELADVIGVLWEAYQYCRKQT